MSLVKLNIKGISYSQTQNGAYALILNEVDGDRKLPIVIGAFEAQSIAIALEKEISPPRPLTHDLFKNFADRFDIVVKQVIIHNDARTSDAIALALRFQAPIFTYKNILDKAGIYLKVNPKKENEGEENQDSILMDELVTNELEPDATKEKNFKSKTLEELQTLLEEAVTNEDYEKAASIRDEISKRE